jgi:hypothetical protein
MTCEHELKGGGSMEKHMRQTAAEEHEEALRTYLQDHVAGAQHAVQLLEALNELYAATSMGHFAVNLLQRVEQDLAVLKRLATNAGAEGFELKEVAGWLGDKLGRMKLAPLGKRFNTFEALEFLSLGILGKRALWKALMSVASEHPELHDTDFATLIERAEAQYAETEEMRLFMAGQAFGLGQGE